MRSAGCFERKNTGNVCVVPSDTVGFRSNICFVFCTLQMYTTMWRPSGFPSLGLAETWPSLQIGNPPADFLIDCFQAAAARSLASKVRVIWQLTSVWICLSLVDFINMLWNAERSCIAQAKPQNARKWYMTIRMCTTELSLSLPHSQQLITITLPLQPKTWGYWGYATGKPNRLTSQRSSQPWPPLRCYRWQLPLSHGGLHKYLGDISVIGNFTPWITNQFKHRPRPEPTFLGCSGCSPSAWAKGTPRGL